MEFFKLIFLCLITFTLLMIGKRMDKPFLCQFWDVAPQAIEASN